MPTETDEKLAAAIADLSRVATDLRTTVVRLSEDVRDIYRRTEDDRTALNNLRVEVADRLGAFSANIEKKLNEINISLKDQTAAINTDLAAFKARTDLAIKAAAAAIILAVPTLFGLVGFGYKFAGEAARIEFTIKQQSELINELRKNVNPRGPVP